MAWDGMVFFWGVFDVLGGVVWWCRVVVCMILVY